jgi:conjugative transfer signal peptidase TraF
MARIPTRLIVILIMVGAMGLASLPGKRLLVINTSPSIPRGLYIRSFESPHVGAIVDFRIPTAARTYVLGRCGEVGSDWYIIKPIIAGPGDRVDTKGAWLTVNGARIAPMPPSRDSQGRPLPIWRGDRVLEPDEFFVFSNRIPNSFDGRCYGPIQRHEIEDVRKPLMVW